MKDEILLSLTNAVACTAEYKFAEPITWKIKSGENWAVVGANGSGKTQLINILMGRYPLAEGAIFTHNNVPLHQLVKYVAFTNIYKFINMNEGYYQQRWNTGEEQSVALVQDFFETADADWLNLLVSVLGIEDLLPKRVNMLSSGELRKTLIVLSLLSKPKILILDNPYIGLDVKSRGVLNDLFDQLTLLQGIQFITVVSQPEDIAPVTTHILPVKEKRLLPATDPQDVMKDELFWNQLFGNDLSENLLLQQCGSASDLNFSDAVLFKKVRIKYGERTILKDIDWQIKKGEKWLLWGENGSGKSTLLSLVFCDNPQSYANDITLFDKKRGAGESIWEVKRRIGYISPEISLYYKKNISCMDVVGSGFFDTIGSPRKCSEEQLSTALHWMRVFEIEHLKDVPFLQVSSGERQLVLLARLFVKNPDLLVLDEPLHGLDRRNKERVKHIIEDYCDDNKSLIYVTHYEEDVLNIITHKLVLRKQY